MLGAVVVAVLVAGCDTSCFRCGDPCERCAEDEICHRWRGCRACAESVEASVCTDSCVGDVDCRDGEVCVVRDGVARCSPFCEPDRCGDGLDCTSPWGACASLSCSDRIACPSGELCDAPENTCRSPVGSCAVAEDCPTVHDYLREHAAVECIAGFCEVRAIPRRLPLPSTVAHIDVELPRVGELYPRAEDVVFRWAPVEAAAFLNVLGSAPVSREDAARDVLLSVPLDQSDDQWRLSEAPGVSLPMDRTLYFLVFAVRAGRVEAASDVVPFAVGAEPWLRPGAPCDDVDELPRASCDPTTDPAACLGDCENPVLPMICTTSGCQYLCLSDPRCIELGFGACALPGPRSAVRVCE